MAVVAVLLEPGESNVLINKVWTYMPLDANDRVSQPFDETKMVELAGLESEPLSEMIKVVNKESQNLHAELLLRQLGRAALAAASNSTGNAEQAAQVDELGLPLPVINAGNIARRQFLEKAGVDVRPLSLRDGSGLARQNLVTPAATVRLLAFMANHPFQQQFLDSLVVAGVDGTMERRLQQTPVTGNLRGKTGSLSFVNALSGYLQTRGGTRLIFSLMGNNFVGPSKAVTLTMDRICILLAEYSGELTR
ncbi:MAG: D-alanyl-D-alanine carboxypeptidase/D-alanyl-D-alanine-endopeptidase [Acidobacteria bacterium]|nr:D-alanyl-D-alanine carboxypeptidase/D-alanyl-D-alanine-endopeptidase [Acidobacteriota bacterium]